MPNHMPVVAHPEGIGLGDTLAWSVKMGSGPANRLVNRRRELGLGLAKVFGPIPFRHVWVHLLSEGRCGAATSISKAPWPVRALAAFHTVSSP